MAGVIQQGMEQQTPAAKTIIRSGINAGRPATAARGRAAGKRAFKKEMTAIKRRASAKKKKRKAVVRGVLKAGSAAAKAWGRSMLKKRRAKRR